MVRAKFKVDRIFDADRNGGKRIDMTPAYGGSKENEAFFKWTPSGNIVLTTVNQEAAKYFEVAKEYYVTFEDASEFSPPASEPAPIEPSTSEAA